MTIDTTVRTRTAWHKALIALVLLTSLALRLSDLDAYLTIDERRWANRSRQFRQALLEGDKADTVLSEHPGIITMWAGAAGLALDELVDQHPLGQSPLERRIQSLLKPYHAEGIQGIEPHTFWARRLIALATWAGLCLAAWLLWQWQGPNIALVATAMMALDPLYLALSRLHHLDALLTTFDLLSILCLLAFLYHDPRLSYLIGSAVFAGLAIANKAPGLTLVPWALGAIGLRWLTQPRNERRKQVGRDALASLVWVGVCASTLVVVTPALHASTVPRAIEMFRNALALGDAPHATGNFFRGEIVPVPGPAFYPMVWLFRSTPWSLLGILGLLIRKKTNRSAALVTIAVWVVGYTLTMATMSKQLERYMLPVFPLLDILSAVGWVRICHWLGTRRQATRQDISALFVSAAAYGTVLALLLPTYPYFTAYYNPLAGGPKAAQRTFVIGWGEGLEQVAAYLNEKPDVEKLLVWSQMNIGFERFFRGIMVQGDDCSLFEPDYYILYTGYAQRDLMPEIVEPLWHVQEPEFVATKAGVPYAWLYRNTFGLADAKQAVTSIGSTTDTNSRGLLINDNAAWARDGRLGLDAVVTTHGDREDVLLSDLQRAAAGKESVSTLRLLGLNDDDAWSKVQETLLDHGQVLEHRRFGDIELETYRLANSEFLPEPHQATTWDFGGTAQLTGYSVVQQDNALAVRLRWSCLKPTDRQFKVFIHLLDQTSNIVSQRDAQPQDGVRPTHLWQAGEELIDDHTLTLPAEGLAQGASLRLGLYDAESMARLSVSSEGGQTLGDHVILALE